MAGVSKQFHPDAGHRFFFYDQEGDGFLYFSTTEERDAAAAEAIELYCDDGWSEEVENVVAGEITHAATKCNVRTRPKPEDLDDEGFDKDGNSWPPEWDEICSYELRPLAGDPK